MEFWKLFAERECGEALALFGDISGADRGPDAHKEMDVIGLHREFKNRPTLLITLLANHVFTPSANLVH